MIALLLGIIALVIAIMFATSFDKLANEIRDMRIKYLKIDYVLKNLESENGNLHRHRIRGSRYISPEPQQEETQEGLVETQSSNKGSKIESAMSVDEDGDYYSNVNYTENFSTNDIIEEFD